MAQESKDERESRRILERVAREAEAGGIVQRTTRRAQDHLAATDVDPEDKIEQWGTRIGRTIAALVSIAVIVAVLLYLLRG
jgi:hypothetical protein